MKNISNKSRRNFLASAALGAVGATHALRSFALPGAGSANSRDTSLQSAGLTARVTEEGASIKLSAPGEQPAVHLEASVEGYSLSGKRNVRVLPGGALEMRSALATSDGDRALLLERFSAGGNGSMHWDCTIHASGSSRTAPIHMLCRYPVTKDTQFWTAWSDPLPPAGSAATHRVTQWRDPLKPMPPAKRRFYYGAPSFKDEDPRIGFTPVYGDLIAIPLASFLERKSDAGFSMAISPEAGDGLLDLTLDADEEGSADFAFYNYRLEAGKPVQFAADFFAHEADWRGGIRWMTHRYPRYFRPQLVQALALDGTAAYSTDNSTDFDAKKLRAMAFRTNWKASFDFPYMGMFLPPAGKASWPRFSGDSDGKEGANHSNGFIDVRQMAEYSVNMRSLGFYVLNYFNVTEFGANIVYPRPSQASAPKAELWRNANDFLYGRLAQSIVDVPENISRQEIEFYPHTRPGGPFFTWGDGIVLDCGEPEYENFLLAQAREHIEKLPASSGICIDRMDWLRLYNGRRDDGVSWRNGKPARSLYLSWRTLMAQLLPMMHGAGKVVFVNNHLKRFDLLLDIDGIFDEFAVNGASLNLTALLAVSRPALGWTNDENAIREDPDSFFQRFLYMGVFPMAPFPGNDHSILPSAWADRQYLDYGPLMNALHGRTWVLEPHAVELQESEAVANVFSVAGGYAVPIMMGGNSTNAKVSLRAMAGMNRMDAAVLHPGTSDPSPVSRSRSGERIIFEVPLVRGCALLRLQKRAA